MCKNVHLKRKNIYKLKVDIPLLCPPPTPPMFAGKKTTKNKEPVCIGFSFDKIVRHQRSFLGASLNRTSQHRLSSNEPI